MKENIKNFRAYTSGYCVRNVGTSVYTGKSNYFTYLRGRSRVHLFLRRLFVRHIVKFFSGRVLDIGSGIGVFLGQYPRAIGVDTDQDCVRYCAEKGFACIRAEVQALPFRHSSFDGVLLNNVLEHLTAPDQAFSEITRVLRDRGRLMIELPGKKGFFYDKTHVRFWGEKDIVPFLEQRNFRVIRVYYFPVPCEYAGDILTHNKLRVSAVLRKEPGGAWRPSAPNA